MKKALIVLCLSGILAGGIAYANTAPIWTTISNQSATVGEELRFRVRATDPDGGTLHYYALAVPLGANFDNDSRLFTWTPNRTGTFVATFRVFDSHASFSDMDVVIEVTNSTPTIDTDGGNTGGGGVFSDLPIDFLSFNPPTTAREGQLYTYTVQARSGGNQITYRLINAPQGMTISSGLGVILWIPNFSQGQSAPYLVTVGASNGYRESWRSYYITVQDVQPAVVAPAAPATPSPTAPVAPAPEEAPEKTTDEESDQLTNISLLAAIGAILFSPWLLLLALLILAILLYRSRKEVKIKKQELALKK